MSRANRIYTLLHDPQYRVAVAWQNTAYNQPPHPGFFIGANMPTPPTPNIVLVGSTPPDPTTPTYQLEAASLGGGTVSESTNGGFIGSGYANFSATGGFAQINNVDGRGGGSHSLRIRFALGATASRTGRLLVNGVAQNITFNPTGAWTTWVTSECGGDAEQRHGEYHPLRVERAGPGERRPGGNPVMPVMGSDPI